MWARFQGFGSKILVLSWKIWFDLNTHLKWSWVVFSNVPDFIYLSVKGRELWNKGLLCKLNMIIKDDTAAPGTLEVPNVTITLIHSSIHQMLSHAWLFASPWTVTHQAPLSMGFSKQDYWNGLPFPPPQHHLNRGTRPTSPLSPALAGGTLYYLSHWGSPMFILIPITTDKATWLELIRSNQE